MRGAACGDPPCELPSGVFGCRHCPLALPPEVVHGLAARYAEPQRAYHTASHIAEVLRWFDWVADRTGWIDRGRRPFADA